MRSAYETASSSAAYFVRGQKNPRNPSPLVRGTTCTCRCGTDCDTTLFTATNDPCASNAVRTAAATERAAPNNGTVSSSGSSTSVGTCSRGTSNVCPLNTGRTSRNPTTSGVSSTICAGVVPAMIEQNRQSATSPVSRPRSTSAKS